MNESNLIKAFNEWLRQYEKDPDQFAHSYSVIKSMLAQRRKRQKLTYGDECVATLKVMLKAADK
jgi:GrpB-like predicted nucleotidyltransferase (UPF0157 family)